MVTSFSQVEFESKKRIDATGAISGGHGEVVPWAEPMAVIEPHYPTGSVADRRSTLARMLRVYFVQQWSGLSDVRSTSQPVSYPLVDTMVTNALILRIGH